MRNPSSSTHRPGYALLLGVLLMATMLSMVLGVSSYLLTQVRLSSRVVDAAQALAAADSGTERALYIDFKVTPLTNGQVITSTGLAPFGDPATAPLSYTVTATVGGTTQLTVQGKTRGSQRSLQLNY